MIYNVVPFQWDFCINTMWHKCIESNGGGVLGSGGTVAKFEVEGFSIIEGHLMQYTGLKDSDGKEIYHKDIVKCLPSGLYGVVEWIDELGMFTLQLIGQDADTPVYSKQVDGKNIMREVIGNIYENKDLLKYE